MKFLKEIWKKIRRKDEDAAESMKDHVRDSAEAITEAKGQIGKITGAIAKYMAEKKKIEDSIPQYKAEVKKYNSAAEKALDNNREDLATKALEAVGENESLLVDAQKRLKVMESDIAKMRKKLDSHKKTVRDAEVNQKKFAAVHEMNQARKTLQKAEASFDGDNSLGSLNKLESMVKQQDAEMDAMDELSSDGLDELDDLVEDSAVSDRLAALKAKRAPATA